MRYWLRREGEDGPTENPDMFPPLPVEDPPVGPAREPDAPIDEPVTKRPARVETFTTNFGG